jgi:hypothetical protein
MLGAIALEPTPRVRSITMLLKRPRWALERHSSADEKYVEHLSNFL